MGMQEVIYILVIAITMSTFTLTLIMLWRQIHPKELQKLASFQDIKDVYEDQQTIKTLLTNLTEAMQGQTIPGNGNGNGHAVREVGLEEALAEIVKQPVVSKIGAGVHEEAEAQPEDIPTPEEQLAKTMKRQQFLQRMADGRARAREKKATE